MTDLSPQTLILGRFVVLNEVFTALHNQRVGKVESKGIFKFNNTFLLNALNQDRVRKKIILTATGTTVRHSSPDRILDNHVVYPNLFEQAAIGARIDAIDEIIRSNQAQVKKNEKLKKGLMQDLLTGKVQVAAN